MRTSSQETIPVPTSFPLLLLALNAYLLQTAGPTNLHGRIVLGIADSAGFGFLVVDADARLRAALSTKYPLNADAVILISETTWRSEAWEDGLDIYGDHLLVRRFVERYFSNFRPLDLSVAEKPKSKAGTSRSRS